MSTLLRGIDGIMEIVEGKTQKPEKPSAGAGDAALASYNETVKEYMKLESMALLLITNNIADETLDKVIRFSTPKEVWDELHRLYDGVNDNRVYDLCLEFFRLHNDPLDDMQTHISKLKNLWFKLKQELVKAEEGSDLPELLLICKYWTHYRKYIFHLNRAGC